MIGHKAKRELNRLISKDVVAIPVLTANMALVLEYWVLEIGQRLPWFDTTAWSLIIFHAALVIVLYGNIVWENIEEKAEETVENMAED